MYDDGAAGKVFIMIKWLALVWISLAVARVASAAEMLDFHVPTTVAGATTAKAMRSLAERALPVYQNPSRATFLANLSALQMVAGQYAAAEATRESLHEFRKQKKTARAVDLALIYDLYSKARAQSLTRDQPFSETFARALLGSLKSLSNRNAFTLARWLATPLSVYRANMLNELDRLRGRKRVSLDEAVDLAWLYVSYEAFRSFGPFVEKLVAEDDARRYVVQQTAVPVSHRRSIPVVVIRPKNASGALPALLELMSGTGSRIRARECAAYGYAGVAAFAPVSGKSPARHSERIAAGDAARVVIDWVAEQRWSDGQVGLYGSGESALAAWKSARHPPRALAALAVSSVAAPARDVSEPRVERRRIVGRNPSEPVHLAVLATTGYFDTNEAASLAQLDAERRRDSNARERLLIGPYDSEAMRRGALPVLAGYSIDSSAIIDLRKLRFAWFAHVLRGAPLPHLLAGRVNYEVMNANEWRHVSSVSAMANWSIRLYPNNRFTGDHYGMTGHAPSGRAFVEVPVALKVGETATRAGSAASGAFKADSRAIMTRTLAARGAVFVSGPLYRPLEVSGRVSGTLIFAARLRGLSVDLRLYALRPGGQYFRFLSLRDVICGDCAAERAIRGHGSSLHRRMAFESERLTSIELMTGTRIVLVLVAHRSVSKPTREAHGRAQGSPSPPVVKWYGKSFIELPVWRAAGS